MKKSIDCDKYFTMVNGFKLDTLINEFRPDIANFIVHTMKMDKLDSYFELEVSKKMNDSIRAAFSIYHDGDGNVLKSGKKLTVNKQFMIDCGLLGKRDTILGVIKHELVHFYVVTKFGYEAARDGAFIFEQKLKEFGAPSSSATPEHLRYTDVTVSPMVYTIYKSTEGEIVQLPLVCTKTLYNVVIDNVHYKHLEAKKILITDEQ